MEQNKLQWRGNDINMSESIECYGMVYTYDGDNFNGYAVIDTDEDGVPSEFAPIWMDNSVIDDYFADEGDAIAKMCGTTPQEMDYEWKFDALLSYYGSYEFIQEPYRPLTKDELIAKIKDNWFGKV